MDSAADAGLDNDIQSVSYHVRRPDTCTKPSYIVLTEHDAARELLTSLNVYTLGGRDTLIKSTDNFYCARTV